jgi:acetyl esterase/lipase
MSFCTLAVRPSRSSILLAIVVAAFSLSFAPRLTAQNAAPQTVLLWPDGAPGAQGHAAADQPSLTIYPSADPSKVPTGVIVFPGGSYTHLAMDHEGNQIAAWLNQRGISAFVLQYRLGPKYHHPVELWDAQRAIRYVRAHAADWNIQPNRIGIWGFSAGGHLASTAGTHFDAGDRSAVDPINRESSRPDFMILAYPVITLEDPYAHTGSRTNLLGEKPDPALIGFLSNERQVTAQTPPAFLFHTTEDPVVPVENSVQFYLALRKAGVPAEMHIYLKGRHGVGLAADDAVLRTWPDRLADWLHTQGLR